MNKNNPEGYFFFTTVFASIRPRLRRPGQAAFSGSGHGKRRLLRRMERPNGPPAAVVAGLAAPRDEPSGGPGTDVVPVAVDHLRCTAAAAIQLRDAIDKALLIGAPVQNPEGKAN